MDNNDLNQFRYHPQINKKIDGIILVPKNKNSSKPIQILPLSPTAAIDEKPLFKGKKTTNKVLGFFTAFSLIFLFSILPIRILESGSNMNAEAKESFAKLEDVYQSIQNNDYEKAKTDLSSINKSINEISKELDDVGQKNIFVSRFFPLNDSSMNDERFFETVLALSKIGGSLIDDFKFTEKIDISNIDSSAKENQQLFHDLEKINQDLKSVENEFKMVKLNIAKVDDSNMNEKEKQYLSLIKQNINEVEKYYNSAIALTSSASSLLGKDYDKKYLVLFQNNTEIRATGGFTGTYGIITIRSGKIKDIFIDSIYNPDGQISKKIEPPEPLKKITNDWAMRDANWYPDFSMSAKNISNFYEIEGGFTPDGIIAFDTKPFLDLLEITGPIELPKYGIEINKENFIPTTQYKTSVDYDPNQNNPKKFLADFAPLFLEKLSTQDPDKQKRILGVLLNNIKEKHIQFYSPEEGIQKAFEDIDIAGKIKETEDSDYFAYINSNIGGLKTNSEITDELSHKITIDENKNITHNVELKRKHGGTKNDGINYAYLRFYLPKGSKIIDVKNFEKKDSVKRNTTTGMIYLEEGADKYLGKAGITDLDIYEESGKTVVGGWQVLRPGEELSSEITYQLPKNIGVKDGNYSILIQKQSGIVEQTTNITVDDLISKKSSTVSIELRNDKTISIPLNK